MLVSATSRSIRARPSSAEPVRSPVGQSTTTALTITRYWYYLVLSDEHLELVVFTVISIQTTSLRLSQMFMELKNTYTFSENGSITSTGFPQQQPTPQINQERSKSLKNIDPRVNNMEISRSTKSSNQQQVDNIKHPSLRPDRPR